MYKLFQFLTYSLGILLIISCRGDELKRMPDTLPDITGTITSITATETTQKNVRLQMTVEAAQGTESVYKQANVKVIDDTLIENKDGKRLKAGQLREGQQVEVWFSGAVRESMPVQTTAVAVRVNDKSQ